MRKILLSLLCLLLGLSLLAQRTGVREEVINDWNKASGLDCLYDQSPKASTPVPKGYEAVYIAHYGRHGSRYAYTARAYTVPLELLTQGKKEDNLTPYGEQLLAQLQPFWEKVQYKVGDLTPLGWQQHQYIASTMVKSFPTVFGKGSKVDACSSASVRCIISMGSFCAALSRLAPRTEIYEHQGILDMQATRPNDKNNPFRYEGPESASVFPDPESPDDFFLRKLPGYKDILGRMFKHPESALGTYTPFKAFFNFYLLVGGMNSLPEDEKLDLSGIFTPEEYAAMWEAANYDALREYVKYRTPNSAIVDDIIAKADATLAAGGRGAHLRFGHDHVVMSLLLLLDVDDFANLPENNDELVYWFQNFRAPKATNLQFVFYQPKKGKAGDTLVKLLLNGEEVRLGKLPPVSGPYYKWADARAYLQERVALVTYKPTPLKVMSFNVRYGKADDGDNSWPYRCEAAAAMVNDQHPAVFGVQEALTFQLDYLQEHCPGYKWVGVGRDDGVEKGEFMAVFYDTSRISLEKWGTYWLSETPDEPSLGWDARCRRTATWTLLKDNRNGKKFFFVDTHLDHRGVQARRNGTLLLVERIGAMNPDGWPMILLGDFNVQPDDPCLTDLNALMQDSRKTAPQTDSAPTYHGWGKSKIKGPIDYIYYSGFSFCRSFQRVTQPYLGRAYVSDHYPITAEFDF